MKIPQLSRLSRRPDHLSLFLRLRSNVSKHPRNQYTSRAMDRAPRECSVGAEILFFYDRVPKGLGWRFSWDFETPTLGCQFCEAR